MEQIKISHLTFSYEGDSAFSLTDVSFTVEKGEIVLVIGESGCGKTTLLRHIKPDCMPQGKRSTDSVIRIGRKRIEEMSEREQAKIVGFVGQNVDSLQATDTVWHELAFGLESLGYSQPVMQRRVAEMVSFFGLEEIYHKKLSSLSGGQKQLVNLASVMAMEPEILVLDEPTSQLDPVAAAEFLRIIEKIHHEIGTTIILSEHRLEEVFSLCDSVLVMEQGSVVIKDTPQKAAQALYQGKKAMAKALPAAAGLYFGLREDESYEETGKEKIPLTVNTGRLWLEDFERRSRISHEAEGNATARYPVEKDRKGGEAAVRAQELWFRYEREGRDVLKACSVDIEKGKITAVLGGNGTGKSTMLHVLAGHFTAYRGKIKHRGSIGMLPQNPQAMFVTKTVREELEASARAAGGNAPSSGRHFTLQEIIDFCNLEEVLYRHPFDLSGGQRQKLALAKLLLEDYDILLLDEPGKGMDFAFKLEMGGLLRQLTGWGKTILLVSHDIEFCARYADVCGMFFDGQVMSVSDARSFFVQNVFYTTAVVRMCRRFLPQAVLPEDVLSRFGKAEKKNSGSSGINPVKEKQEGNSGGSGTGLVREKTEEDRDGCTVKDVSKPERRRRYGITFVIFFVVMPLTIYLGHTVLYQRKYYFISLLLVLEAVLSFFLSFEKRRPRLREIMVIALLSAIAVTARAAFYMVPQAKPMAAIVILSGVGLGGEAGFLVGAMAMLVSNIFFGQGPWTPWQMFAMGMLGFLAGIVFKQNTDCGRNKKYGICLFGLLSVILIYGGIMNPSSVLLYQEQVNLEMIVAACVMGLPFDVIHGAFTFLFLWIGAGPVLEKIGRIRRKIGMNS